MYKVLNYHWLNWFKYQRPQDETWRNIPDPTIRLWDHLSKIKSKQNKQKTKKCWAPQGTLPTPKNLKPITNSLERHNVDNLGPQTKHTVPGLALPGCRRMLAATVLLNAKTGPHVGEVAHHGLWGSKISEKAPFILIKLSASQPPNSNFLREIQKHPI